MANADLEKIIDLEVLKGISRIERMLGQWADKPVDAFELLSTAVIESLSTTVAQELMAGREELLRRQGVLTVTDQRIPDPVIANRLAGEIAAAYQRGKDHRDIEQWLDGYRAVVSDALGIGVDYGRQRSSKMASKVDQGPDLDHREPGLWLLDLVCWLCIWAKERGDRFYAYQNLFAALFVFRRLLADYEPRFTAVEFESSVLSNRFDFVQMLYHPAKPQEPVIFVLTCLWEGMQRASNEIAGPDTQPVTIEASSPRFDQFDEQVLALIEADAFISQVKMGKQLKRSPKTVERSLSRLKMRGRIAREGTRQGGRWVVLES
ncbi:hypothetical protein GCM10011352_04940 [Marinobacterium zhoushanense]|uniref:HTH domain-containing protein n=1 Tax=Marinobacterium zhoushanense TaxID=1679163 RepID=A0ABQ1JZB3_9GAMM|nr:winged helix-turn-helix domain-containing protein [Marinobacterium zhoushanense]GGB82141.1 hypothetical protein GCM10011352_04940 [Marinobacterium zhoushanense]